jgi:hypothetical protein
MKITRRQLKQLINEEIDNIQQGDGEAASGSESDVDTDDIDLAALTGGIEDIVSQLNEGGRLSDADLKDFQKLIVVTLKAFQMLSRSSHTKGGTYHSIPFGVKAQITAVKMALEKIYNKMNFKSVR